MTSMHHVGHNPAASYSKVQQDISLLCFIKSTEETYYCQSMHC